MFLPGVSQFEVGVPAEPTTLELRTFVESAGFDGTQALGLKELLDVIIPGTAAVDAFNELGISAADQAGISRLFGGIHTQDGDINGRAIGSTVGLQAFELAQRFIDGRATDADRPFNDPSPFEFV